MLLKSLAVALLFLICFRLSIAAPSYTLSSNRTRTRSERTVSNLVPASRKPGYYLSKWEMCPQDQYVFAFSLMTSTNVKEPLRGISLTCGGSNGKRTNISAVQVDERFRKFKACSNPGVGMAVGFQLKHSSNKTLPSLNKRKRDNVLNENMSKGVIDAILYCDNLDLMSTVEIINFNIISSSGVWKEPKLCGWGELICGIRGKFDSQDHLIGVDMKCCRDPSLMTGPLRFSYREVNGRILQSVSEESLKETADTEDVVYRHHYKKQPDDPYYFKWSFCNNDNYGYEYVTGLQLSYENHAIRFFCSDMSRAPPRAANSIKMPNKAFWENQDVEEDAVSDEVHCDGVAIGFQAKYHVATGIQAVKIFCSFSETPSELSFITGYFEPPTNNNLEGSWQKPQLCGRNQAICGFKTHVTRNTSIGNSESQLEHIKVKCCDVPEISDICYPEDKFELLVECDATEALADTMCTYSQSEGVTIQNSKSLSDQLNEEFHKSLAQEWGSSEADTERKSDGQSQSIITTESKSTSNSDSITNSDSNSYSNTNGSSLSNLVGNTIVSSDGQNTGLIEGSSSSRAQDLTDSSSKSENVGNTQGNSKSQTDGSSQGWSKSGSQGHTKSLSTGYSDSNTKGVSKGTMSSSTLGKTDSSSTSSTRGNSQSQSDSKTNSRSSGSSSMQSEGGSNSVSANVGFTLFGFSAGLSTNFETNFQNQRTQTEESSSSLTSQVSRESSFSQTSQYGSEVSSSNTDQRNTEESRSETFQKNHENRQDISNSLTNEANEQKNTQTGLETSHQQTKNSGQDVSFTNATRQMEESNRQNTTQISKDSSNSTNNQTNIEQSFNQQNAKNQEEARQKSSTSTGEFSMHNTLQKSNDTTVEWNRSKSRNKNVNQGNRFTTGYDWSKSSSHTWNMERRFEVSMTVPAGHKSQLFQVVGYCAYYNVRTSKYKRLDFKRQN